MITELNWTLFDCSFLAKEEIHFSFLLFFSFFHSFFSKCLISSSKLNCRKIFELFSKTAHSLSLSISLTLLKRLVLLTCIAITAAIILISKPLYFLTLPFKFSLFFSLFFLEGAAGKCHRNYLLLEKTIISIHRIKKKKIKSKNKKKPPKKKRKKILNNLCAFEKHPFFFCFYFWKNWKYQQKL